MNYNLSFLNVYDYLDFFLLIGFVEKSEMTYNTDILDKMNTQAIDIANSFISDKTSLHFNDFQITCATIKLVRELNKFQNKWNNIFKEMFLIDENNFSECFEVLKS